MSATKNLTEEKIQIKQFKDSSSNFWISGKHYHLNKNNEIVLCAGGNAEGSEIELLRVYIKRNGKKHVPREIIAQIQYNEILLSGKYQSKTVSEVKDIDRKYLIWMRDNYSYSATQEKLKQQIINILK